MADYPHAEHMIHLIPGHEMEFVAYLEEHILDEQKRLKVGEDLAEMIREGMIDITQPANLILNLDGEISISLA